MFLMLKTPYPLEICYIAIEHGPFIVDFPIEDGDFPVRYVNVYQRVFHGEIGKIMSMSSFLLVKVPWLLRFDHHVCW